ncbi:MAG: hypothetical protein IKF01_00255 [Bacilli bacterium]|nr:hypothetical protein [Bacilli bacterium]
MNYIYDVILNFNRFFYDFYEWNDSDKIVHIRKIPSFKVSSDDLCSLKYNNIKIDDILYNKIFNKTETFRKKDVKGIMCSCIFSDGKDIIAISFDSRKVNYLKSSLGVDESDEIMDIVKYQKEIKLPYKVIDKKKLYSFKTRFEIENEIFMKNELDKIYNNHDYKKLNYICLECFGKTDKNFDRAISTIKKEIIKGNDNFYKIFKIFKMTEQK